MICFDLNQFARQSACMYCILPPHLQGVRIGFSWVSSSLKQIRHICRSLSFCTLGNAGADNCFMCRSFNCATTLGEIPVTCWTKAASFSNKRGEVLLLVKGFKVHSCSSYYGGPYETTSFCNLSFCSVSIILGSY